MSTGSFSSHHAIKYNNTARYLDTKLSSEAYFIYNSILKFSVLFLCSDSFKCHNGSSLCCTMMLVYNVDCFISLMILLSKFGFYMIDFSRHVC